MDDQTHGDEPVQSAGHDVPLKRDRKALRSSSKSLWSRPAKADAAKRDSEAAEAAAAPTSWGAQQPEPVQPDPVLPDPVLPDLVQPEPGQSDAAGVDVTGSAPDDIGSVETGFESLGLSPAEELFAGAWSTPQAEPEAQPEPRSETTPENDSDRQGEAELEHESDREKEPESGREPEDQTPIAPFGQYPASRPLFGRSSFVPAAAGPLEEPAAAEESTEPEAPTATEADTTSELFDSANTPPEGERDTELHDTELHDTEIRETAVLDELQTEQPEPVRQQPAEPEPVSPEPALVERYIPPGGFTSPGHPKLGPIEPEPLPARGGLTALDVSALVTAVVLPPIGLITAIVALLRGKKVRGWASDLARAAVAVSLVMTVVFAGVGGYLWFTGVQNAKHLAAVKADQRAHDLIETTSLPFCNFLAEHPTIYSTDDPDYGWPALDAPGGYNAAIAAYAAAWAELAQLAPAGIAEETTAIAERVARVVEITNALGNSNREGDLLGLHEKDDLATVESWYVEYCNAPAPDAATETPAE